MNRATAITILRCRPPLAMAKTWKVDGTIVPYSTAKHFTPDSQGVSGIGELSALLIQLEKDRRACVIRGELLPNAARLPCGEVCRNSKAFMDIPRQWLALDIDDFQPQRCDPIAQPAAAVEEFLKTHMPDFADVSHHWQLTGSAGCPTAEGKLKARVWFWLEDPRTSQQLKAWGKQRWPAGAPFDTALFSATQIHYTAAPVFEAGVDDPVSIRSGMTMGKKGVVKVPLVEAPARELPSTSAPASGEAYTRSVLDGIEEDIATAPMGTRNNTLYKKARRAFSLVHAKRADESEVRAMLEGAAAESGMKPERVSATLASAWTASQKSPDDVSPQRAGEGFDAECPPEETLARVAEALDKAEADPGALFEPDILKLIRAIRQSQPAEWQRIRASAKAAKVQISELDRLTQPTADQDQGSKMLFPVVEPWPEPVDGASLVRELSDTLRQYVVCEPETADAAALWITFTWFIDVVHVAPIANITAPLPNCGKSTLLDFMERFTFQPLKCDGISPAALFRSMDRWRPTLLVDEVDSFLRDNEDARGVLNSGHKRNGFIIRVVGEDHDPMRFSTWGAKALCGIGSVADTLDSRSIRLELRRKLPHEKVGNLRFLDGEHQVRLVRQLCRLHDDIASQVESARPQPVTGLDNRAQDNWEPLLQIADSIGGEWPERVRSIAITISRMDDNDQASDVGTELLKDIKAVFDARDVDRIFSADLQLALQGDSEAPWATWNRGKPITARQVARKLAGFNIKPKQVRIGATTKKGYLLDDFHDAFKRYLSSDTPDSTETTKQSSNHEGYSGFPSDTLPQPIADEQRRKASNQAGCFVVSDKFPPPRERRDDWLENHPLL